MTNRFSVRRLEHLESAYKSTIRRMGSEKSERLDKIISSVEKNIRNAVKEAIQNALKDKYADLISVGIDQDQHSKTIDIRINVSYKTAAVQDETINEMLSLKREICEFYKEKYTELDAWKVKCLEEGECLPFSVPDYVPKSLSLISCI